MTWWLSDVRDCEPSRDFLTTTFNHIDLSRYLELSERPSVRNVARVCVGSIAMLKRTI